MPIRYVVDGFGGCNTMQSCNRSFPQLSVSSTTSVRSVSFVHKKLAVLQSLGGRRSGVIQQMKEVYEEVKNIPSYLCAWSGYCENHQEKAAGEAGTTLPSPVDGFCGENTMAVSRTLEQLHDAHIEPLLLWSEKSNHDVCNSWAVESGIETAAPMAGLQSRSDEKDKYHPEVGHLQGCKDCFKFAKAVTHVIYFTEVLI
uniref:Uncharacterized protein n=1 Tax=Ditylenchus dipsaci TaxID=166011 RepID=A0A915D2P7_9BILA